MREAGIVRIVLVVAPEVASHPVFAGSFPRRCAHRRKSIIVRDPSFPTVLLVSGCLTTSIASNDAINGVISSC